MKLIEIFKYDHLIFRCVLLIFGYWMERRLSEILIIYISLIIRIFFKGRLYINEFNTIGDRV